MQVLKSALVSQHRSNSTRRLKSVSPPRSAESPVQQQTVAPLRSGPQISIVEAKNPKNNRVTHVGGYFFIANNRYAARASGVKSIAYDPKERSAYYLKVQVTYQTKAGPDEATREYLPIVEDLLDDLVPAVMQILPDWPELERRQKTDGEAAA